MASALSNPAAEASPGRDPAVVTSATTGLHFSAHPPLPAKWNNNSISRHAPPGKALLATARDLKPKGKSPPAPTTRGSPPMRKSRGIGSVSVHVKKSSKNVSKPQQQQQRLVDIRGEATGLTAAPATTITVSCDSIKKEFSRAPPCPLPPLAPPPPPPPPPPSASSPPSGPGPVSACSSVRVCEDLLCSSDELRVFTEEGEEEERESGGARLLQEEIEAALFEEKTSLIRETELGLKQEGFFSRLEAGESFQDAD